MCIVFIRALVSERIKSIHNVTFRDIDELNQATQFLHDNGVLLHYQDVSLSNLYFLDPQWLCDMLAHVITISPVNMYVKNGTGLRLLLAVWAFSYCLCSCF